MPRKDDPKLITGPETISTSLLKETTVLVTRPENQSGDLTSQLEQRGATVIHCPTIEIAPPRDWESVDRAIATIASYNWLVFTSANGARYFFDRFEERESRPFQKLSPLAICTIGPATARAVEAIGAPVDLIVKDSRAEGVLRALIDHEGGPARIRGQRFLIPCARHARDFLPGELRKLAAQVDVVEAYQTLKPNVDLVGLLALRKIDVITFTSPSTVSNFARLAGTQLFADLANKTIAACIGPVTVAAANDQGFRRIVQAESATTQALVVSIARAIGNT
ncbi:MAG TPA: uroporphyrinogen-III synthase [Blastocatellia bacterium]|nr:uroporphyrinogen-III synthase [Blastocatellia bacterium]